VTVLNGSTTKAVHVSIDGMADGRRLVIQDLQKIEIPPGGHRAISMHLHTDLAELPIVVTADGPVVVERGFFRRNGRGISLSMGIPIDHHVVWFDPLEG